MADLKEFEEEKQCSMNDLEVYTVLFKLNRQNWYENEVKAIENTHSQQLEQCEKELDV